MWHVAELRQAQRFPKSGCKLHCEPMKKNPINYSFPGILIIKYCCLLLSISSCRVSFCCVALASALALAPGRKVEKPGTPRTESYQQTCCDLTRLLKWSSQWRSTTPTADQRTQKLRWNIQIWSTKNYIFVSGVFGAITKCCHMRKGLFLCTVFIYLFWCRLLKFREEAWGETV